MGQNSSSPSDDGGTPANRRSFISRPLSRLEQSESEGGSNLREGWPLAAEARSPSSRSSQSLTPLATFRRQISARTTPVRPISMIERTNPIQDEVIYESEERPLMSMRDLGMREAPIEHISADPIPRRRSVVSRVGERVRERYSMISNIGQRAEDSSDEGLHSVFETSPRVPAYRATLGRIGSIRNRIPILNHFPRSRSNTSIQSSARGRFASISRPIPQPNDATLSPQFGVTDPSRRAPTPGALADRVLERSAFDESPSRRQSRRSRVRQSISAGLAALVRTSFAEENRQAPPAAQRATMSSGADDSDFLIPPIAAQNHSIDLEDPLGRSSEATDRTPLEALDSLLDRHERSLPWPSRLTDRISASRRNERRMSNLLRGRSSRLIRRDDETPLSRILQVAAAAIAAQLSGSTDALANLEAIGDDHFDGNLNSFVEELNNATNSAGSTRDSTAANFWRVFRFANNQEVRQNVGQQILDAPEALENRTVTLVVVGVRSVPSSSINRENGFVESSLDTLLDLPALNSTTPHPHAGSSLLGTGLSRSRFPTRRRASSGLAPSGHSDALRSQFTQDNSHVNASGRLSDGRTDSDSPAGPHPPPSTPSERLSLSPIPTHTIDTTSTPNSQQNETQANMPWYWPRHRNQRDNADAPSPVTNEQASASTPALQFPPEAHLHVRRRSDSEAARHRLLGTGNARRNGVVAPDDVSGQGRSWLIYVVGTNLAENHPALATPSLFGDNPTYEDMVRLSALLGPAKPPVASIHDVDSAGGLYRVGLDSIDGSLRAESHVTLEAFNISQDAQCIVCQAGYEIDEVVRQLHKCSHFFHQDCVDTWLTTGRNSCPLCREKGVEECNAGQSSGPSGSGQGSDIGRAI